MLDQMFRINRLLLLLLLISTGCGSIIVPESTFLEDAKMTPSKLKMVRDSVQFEVSGSIPIESVLSPRNPRLSLLMKSSDGSREFKSIALKKEVGHYSYKELFKILYEPWMEGAFLELQLRHGKQHSDKPNEKQFLTRGVITTPLLARVGKVYPDEPIPQIGLYIPTGAADVDLSRTKYFTFLFDAGSSDLKMNASNSASYNSIKAFLMENSSVSIFRITGTQSPEVREGRNSRLGMDRAEAVHRLLAASTIPVSEDKYQVTSRWNDWFDFRMLLRDYDRISTKRKDEFYKVLLSDSPYETQAEALKKISEFNQVSRDLYPKLRAVTVEITAKPLPGLNQDQAALLKKSLQEKSATSELDMADWAIAGEASPRLDDKEQIYSKMTELFRSVVPYNNLAVVKMRQAQQTLDTVLKDSLWNEANRLLYQASKIENNPYVLHNQGQILILQNKHWEAYKKLSDASVLTRNEDFLKINESLRGALDILRGDYKLATLRFDYTYSEAKDFFNKGLAYFLADDFANASLAFEESVMAGRNYGYGFYGLAMIAAESGQDEVALIHLDKAIHTSELMYQKALIDPIFDKLRGTEDFFQIYRPKEDSTAEDLK